MDLQDFLSPVKWYLTSLITPYILIAKTINKSGEADTSEEMLNVAHDASVTHFLANGETAERLLNTLKHEYSLDHIKDDSNGYIVNTNGKIAEGIW